MRRTDEHDGDTPGGDVVVGVCGARGGVGASTFAAALARTRARRPGRPVVLVDLDDSGGGVDVLLGIEDQPGLRWPDLRDAQGDVPAPAVLDLLPWWGDVRVLSTGCEGIDPRAREDVLAALAAHAALVLDVPRPTPGQPWWGHACGALVVVARRDLQSVAGAQPVAALAAAHGTPTVLALRGRAPAGLAAHDVRDALGLADVVDVPTERALPAAIERGIGPCGARLHRGAAAALGLIEHAVAGTGPLARGAAPGGAPGSLSVRAQRNGPAVGRGPAVANGTEHPATPARAWARATSSAAGPLAVPSGPPA